jgi:Protein of unknown function (DUF2384)
MQSTPFQTHTPKPFVGPSAGALTAETLGGAHQSLVDEPSKQGFVSMLNAFRPSGGTARGDELANLLQDRQKADYVSLARLISTGRIFSFRWRENFWVPMFQFDLDDLTIKPQPQKVASELAGVLDDWSLARWFAEPHPALHGERPVDCMDLYAADVLSAARADRWSIAG